MLIEGFFRHYVYSIFNKLFNFHQNLLSHTIQNKKKLKSLMMFVALGVDFKTPSDDNQNKPEVAE